VKKKWRTLLIWTLVALLLQFGVYSYLDYKIAQVMNPSPTVITNELEATIPGTDLENIQISYAKDYLAYTQDGVLKVYNLKSQKVIFEKAPEPNSGENMGVLNYQWLPDRNALIYFYARKNPEPVTMVLVEPEPVAQPQVEHPNSEAPAPAPQPEPYYEERYNNPQLTDLYTLELPSSDEETPPDDRYNRTLDNFPSGGQIEQMVFSTYTNLMYLVVRSDDNTQLLEIDVMKNVRTISKKGEDITNISVSDRYGTLFLDSTLGSQKRILVLQGWERFTVDENPNYVILGVRSGMVYLGEVREGNLVKILGAKDKSDFSQPYDFASLWEGSLPYEDQRIIVGGEGQIISYDDSSAYVVSNGQLDQIALDGEEVLISEDGAQLISIRTVDGQTQVKLQPFKY